MVDSIALSKAFSIPTNFSINEVVEPTLKLAVPAVALPPNLGPLAAFVGTWTGQGFNTIFRPDSGKTPTPFVPPINLDNVLELNLTQETLAFSNSLGSVPNRGSGNQADIFLNAVPYLQTISDVTALPATGIHFEPGMWLSVPATTNPNEPATLARMASIPHGTTVIAQGILQATIAGKPTIAFIDITPFVVGNPQQKVQQQSQTANNNATARIPQKLPATITPQMLGDPNTVLRNQIQNQNITETLVIGISTNPAAPLPGGPLLTPPQLSPPFGGGPANIAFLLGVPNPPPVGPNAQTVQMDAVFWIETVVYQVNVPAMPAGTPPLVLQPVQANPPVPLQPSFVASIPFVPGKQFAGGTVAVATTQIQYSQKVMLNFNGLSWPHVSVASLVPADPIPIPANLLPLT